MAWVRYDDQFPINTKVTAVVVEEPGALALHVLANTWSNTTKTPGYVPMHQPTALLYDRSLGEKWADVLVRAGLWHMRGQECDSCRVEYARLEEIPTANEGWVFHNAKIYQAPARDRTTPGTSADLSAKRREAGRKGGQASAAKRPFADSKPKQTGKQTSQQTEANGQANQSEEVSKTLKGASRDSLSAADTFDFAGVSKTSTCSQKSVTPDPVPVPETTNDPSKEGSASSSEEAPSTVTRSQRTRRKTNAAEEHRPDVDEICDYLVRAVVATGSKKPNVNNTWRTEARLLLDEEREPRATVEKVKALIDWIQTSDWWKPRVLAMPKLRSKYDEIRLDALRDFKRKQADRDGQPRSSQRGYVPWQPPADQSEYDKPFSGALP